MAKQTKPFPLCACGCKERTRGGKYRPGHDARHHAKLRKQGKPIRHVMTDEQQAKSREQQAKARQRAKS